MFFSSFTHTSSCLSSHQSCPRSFFFNIIMKLGIYIYKLYLYISYKYIWVIYTHYCIEWGIMMGPLEHWRTGMRCALQGNCVTLSSQRGSPQSWELRHKQRVPKLGDMGCVVMELYCACMSMAIDHTHNWKIPPLSCRPIKALLPLEWQIN